MALIDDIAYGYKLDEASGNALDVNLSNDLTGTGSPGSGSGLFGTCRTFNGSQYFSRADNATLSMANIGFTVMAMVAPGSSTISGTGSTIVGKAGGNDLEYQLQYVGSAGAQSKYRWRLSSGSGFANLNQLYATSFGAATAGVWNVLFGWHDAVNDVSGIEVDGVSNTTSYSAGSYDSGAALEIGNYSFYSEPWYGSIQQVFVWKNRVLSSTERGDIRAAIAGGTGYPWVAGGGPTVWRQSPFRSRVFRSSVIRGVRC